ncbi:hypothetical protein [Nostoc sp.]|uniref:hypothetical protein n=1 Tax=Nostoc sp. TaxID=1180 RepID=UPI002FF6FCA1
MSDEQLRKLQALVQENGISLEDLLRARIEDWLSQPTSESDWECPSLRLCLRNSRQSRQ